MMSIYPVILMFLPIIVSLVMYLVKKPWIHFLVFALQLTLAFVFVILVMAYRQDPSIGLVIFGGWDQRIAITFLIDDINLIFIGLTIFFFFIIYYYSFKSNYREMKFFFFLTFLEGVFLAALMTNDLFNLFVYLELMSLLITLLITYKKVENALKAGLQYLLLSSVAAMFYLIGVLLLYYVFGTINLSLIQSGMQDVLDYTVIKVAYAFMMTAFLLKGAVFPLYAWLPKAHGVAQSSISALLSGLMVKIALYLIIRIHHGMFGSPYGFNDMLLVIGFASSLIGVVFAMSQKDLKQILAYHTVSQVGLMLIGLSFGEGNSYMGGFLHIINHAFFKGLLFLVAGVIIKVYQTKKVSEIRGLFKTLPWTSVLLVVGILSITGAPLWNGFISKTLIKYAFKDNLLWFTLFQLIHIGTMISFSKVIMMVFGSPLKQVHVSRASWTQHIPMTLLAIVSFIIGVAYVPLFDWLFGIDVYRINVLSMDVWFDYFIYALIGFNLYLFVIKKDGMFFKWIRQFHIQFPTSNYLLVLVLVSLLLITSR